MNADRIDDVSSDWNAYRRLVVDALERIEQQYKDLNKKIDHIDGTRGKEISDLRVQLGMLTVEVTIKSTLWASGASVVVSAIASLIVGLIVKH